MPQKMTNFSKWVALVLVIALLYPGWAPLERKVYADQGMAGSGTEQDPYIITNAAELDSIRYRANVHYKLGRDIDLTGVDWDPLSTFFGTLDGNGYAITGLRIERVNGYNIGLFSMLGVGSKVSNLALLDVFIQGEIGVGGLAGFNAGRVENSYVTGTVKGDFQVGGLIGSSDSDISSSYSEASVSGVANVGGLVGAHTEGTLSNTYAHGEVSGESGVGGLVGRANGTIEFSYAAGRVTGTSIKPSDMKTIGGLVGVLDANGSVENSFYDEETTGQSDTGKGTALDSVLLKNDRTLARRGWDLDNFWFVRPNEYPRLRAFETSYALTYDSNGGAGILPPNVNHPSGIMVTSPENMGLLEKQGYLWNGWNEEPDGSGRNYEVKELFLMPDRNLTLYATWTEAMEGMGTVDDPYIITSAAQLSSIRYNLSAFYRLGNDIDLASYTNHWKAIAPLVYNPFIGGLDGDKHVIDGLTIPGSEGVGGLFSNLGKDAVIENLGLTNVSISNLQYVGGIATKNEGTIRNSYVEGEIAGTKISVGGLVSFNSGTIESSYVIGKVSGNSVVGGLAAANSGQIINSYAHVDVVSNQTAGGLVGENDNKIINSYAVGAVSNVEEAGGLVGLNSGTVSDSFYNSEISGMSDTGKGEPRLTDDLMSYLNYVGWDFQNIWKLDGNSYPTHRVWDPKYVVAYDGNGHSGGSLPVDNSYEDGSLVTVAEPDSLVFSGHTFDTWNTAKDGSGLSYAPGDQLTVDGADVTLYAQWRPIFILSAMPMHSGAKLSWTPVAGATKYIVYYDTTSQVFGNPSAEAVEVEADKNVHLLDLPRNGTTYYIGVIAERATGGVVNSDIVGVLPDAMDVASLQLILDDALARIGLLKDSDPNKEQLETSVSELQLVLDQLQEEEELVVDLASYTLLYQKLTQTGQKLFELQLAVSEASIQALDAVVANLNDQVTALKNKVNGLEGEKTTMQDAIDLLNSQVSELQEELGDLTVSGQELAEKVVELTVRAEELQDSLNQAERFATDLLSLQIVYVDGNSAESVTQSFTLPIVGAGGTSIVWSASHDGYVTIADGTASVNRPTYTEGDAFVTLTAKLTLGDLTGSMSQLIRIVKAEPDDAEAVALAVKELTLSYASGDSVHGVTQQLTLPTSGEHGVGIVWRSSHPTIISDSGVVTRPAYDEEHELVTLTAELERGGAKETKAFVVQVLKKVQTASEAVAAAQAALSLELAAGDELSAVRGTLGLATVGVDGTTVAWSSSDPEIVTTEGTVRRPAAAEGDRMVTLTATVAKEGISETKTFHVTVLAYAPGNPFALAMEGTGLGILRDASGIRATVMASRRDTAEQPEQAVIVFQLMRGTESIAIVAFEKAQLASERATAGFFSVNGNDRSYSVKVYVYDELSTSLTSIQTSLAEAVELH